MWWLDDSLSRGGSGDSRRFLFRGSVRIPESISVSPQKRSRSRRKLELTESQIAANQLLLGLDPPNDECARRLRADLESLERVIREQKSQFTELETRLARDSSQHSAALADARQAAEQSIASLREEQSQETQRLRHLLAAAERKIHQRDSELSELRSQADAREHRNAEAWAEAEHQHAVETRYLQSAATAAEQRSAARTETIAKLQTSLREQEESHRNETHELTQTHKAKIDQVISELVQAHQSINSLASELAAGKQQLERLRDENHSLADLNQQHQREHADETRRLKAEISRLDNELESELDRGISEKASLQAAREHDRNAVNEIIHDLRGQLRTAEDRIQQSDATAAGHVQHAEELQQTIQSLRDELAASKSELHQAVQSNADEKSLREQEIASLRQSLTQQHERDRGQLNDKIADLQEQLQTATMQIGQFEVAASERARQAAEFEQTIQRLRGELAVSTSALQAASESRVNERAKFRQETNAACERAQHTAELEQTINRLRDELAASHAAMQVATDTSAAETSQLHQEIVSLKQSLERQQDAAIDQSRQSEATEWDLRAACDTLRRQLDQVSADAAQQTKQRDAAIAELKDSLEQRDRELNSLWSESEQSAEQLDRTKGTLERIRSKNERLLEMHDAQFKSLQSRIDELVVALDTERQKRAVAEQEARRLCTHRSQRILFLDQQREQFSTQVDRLQAEIDGQRENESKLRATLTSVQQAAEETHRTLQETHRTLEETRLSLQASNTRNAEMSTELARLRTDLAEKDAKLESIQAMEAQSSRLESEQLVEAREEIARLKANADQADLERREHQQKIDQFLREQSQHEPDFAILQRDRTIALLEREAIVMQQRLQREAAARRKAEGVIKRKVKNGNLDAESEQTWSEIDANDQLQRLQRQAEALCNINLLERQRAVAEISRYKKEIARLKGNSQRRAA